jgi:hypothetical protein
MKLYVMVAPVPTTGDPHLPGDVGPRTNPSETTGANSRLDARNASDFDVTLNYP